MQCTGGNSLAMALLVSLTLAAAPAAAQQTARELFEAGRVLHSKRDYAGAVALYEKAWSKEPSYEIAANLGQAALAIGNQRQAAKYLAYAVAHAPASDEAARDRLERSLERAEKAVARIQVTVNPPGVRATISIDEREVSELDRSQGSYVNGGEHHISVTAPGFAAAPQTVTVEPGRKYGVQFDLEEVKRTPVVPGPAAPASVRHHPTPEPTSNAKEAVVIAGLGLTALAVGTGVFFTYQERSSQDEYVALRVALLQEAGGEPNFCASPPPSRAARCAKLAEVNDSRERERALSTAGFVIAGVAVVGTATAWLLWPEGGEHQSSAAVVPLPGGAAGAYRAKF